MRKICTMIVIMILTVLAFPMFTQQVNAEIPAGWTLIHENKINGNTISDDFSNYTELMIVVKTNDGSTYKTVTIFDISTVFATDDMCFNFPVTYSSKYSSTVIAKWGTLYNEPNDNVISIALPSETYYTTSINIYGR